MAFYEYMKNRINGQSITPDWVDNGPFLTKSDGTHVAYIPDNRDYWIPDTLVQLTDNDIRQRFLDIHTENPFKNHNMSTGEVTNKTIEEVTQMANDFINYYNN